MKSCDGSLLCQDAATILPSHLSCVPCLPWYVFLLPLSLVCWSPCLNDYKESSAPEKKIFPGEGPEENVEDVRVDYVVVISTEASLSTSVVKNRSANAGDVGLIPQSGRFPGEGNVNPLQFSCLGNTMERGTWRAIVYGVTKQSHDLVTKQKQQVSTDLGTSLALNPSPATYQQGKLPLFPHL